MVPGSDFDSLQSIHWAISSIHMKKAVILLISHSHCDQVMKCRRMTKTIGIFILQLFLLPQHTHTHSESVSLIRPNPLLELFSIEVNRRHIVFPLDMFLDWIEYCYRCFLYCLSSRYQKCTHIILCTQTWLLSVKTKHTICQMVASLKRKNYFSVRTRESQCFNHSHNTTNQSSQKEE